MTEQEPGGPERKADELAKQIQEVENEVKRQELAKLDSQKPGYLERKADELAGQIQEIEEAQSKSFVDPHNLEATLKEVNSYRFMPKGTYHVDFDITIYERGTLEVAPGTKIYFGPEAGIISCGILKAIGKKSEKERILFTASRDKWRNIAIASKWADESVLEYCIITHGSGRKEIPKTNYFEGYSSCDDKGGGLLVVRSDPTIRYCKIENNKARDGGGLYLRESRPILEGNKITGNTARWGGGGLYLFNSSPTIENNTISNNTGSVDGGGLYLYASRLRLVKNTITDNEAEDNGGGIYNFTNSKLKLKGNKIENNKPNNIEK